MSTPILPLNPQTDQEHYLYIFDNNSDEQVHRFYAYGHDIDHLNKRKNNLIDEIELFNKDYNSLVRKKSLWNWLQCVTEYSHNDASIRVANDYVELFPVGFSLALSTGSFDGSDGTLMWHKEWVTICDVKFNKKKTSLGGLYSKINDSFSKYESKNKYFIDKFREGAIDYLNMF